MGVAWLGANVLICLAVAPLLVGFLREPAEGAQRAGRVWRAGGGLAS